MIRKHDADVGTERSDVWAQLAAPLPATAIAWRQDGRPASRDGKFFARFVAYVEANTVRDRLDAVVPGEWNLHLELLPVLPVETETDDATCAFKARLSILGTVREDVGVGKDYKQASTDAFKRVAVRFGIAHELYDYEQNWVQVDGDGKYAKPLEDPGEAYARRIARRGMQVHDGGAKPQTAPASSTPASSSIDDRAPLDEPSTGPLVTDEPSCPKCGGRMWDNRLSKRNPKAPDFKCRSRSCDGVIWPPRGDAAPSSSPSRPPTDDEHEMANGPDADELPF